MTLSERMKPDDDEQDEESREIEEIDPRIKDLADALRGDQETTTAHSVEMTLLIRDIEKGHKTNATPSERERAKTANEEFWKSAMKQLKTTAEHYLRSFPGLFQWPEQIISEVYKTLAILLTGRRTTRVKDRVHFYRLASRNFRFKLLEHRRRGNRRPARSIDDTNFAEPPDTKTGPIELAEQNEYFERYLEVGDEMPEELLDIFDRHCIHKQSFAAIEEELGIATSTSNDRFHRALHWLQNRILEPGKSTRPEKPLPPQD